MTDEEKNGNDNKKEGRKKVKDEIISWVLTIAIALIVAFAINSFVIVNAKVPTGSMENTIMPKDRFIANRLAYINDNPDRGDIVVFKYPDDESVLYVKRVIGLPGDYVEIIDGKVYINNSEEPLIEEYIKEEMYGTYGPYTVPEDCYFMLGDNRNNSLDSRFWENTFVEKEKILGKVIFKYYKGFKLYN